MAVDAEEAEMDACMNKPFKLAELTAVYAKILECDNRNQRDLSTHRTTVTPGVDIHPLGLVFLLVVQYARSPRVRRYLLMLVNQLIWLCRKDGNSSSLEQNGTSPPAAAVKLVTDWKVVTMMAGKTAMDHVERPTGSGSEGNGLVE